MNTTIHILTLYYKNDIRVMCVFVCVHVPVVVLPIRNRLEIGTNVLRKLRPVIGTTLIACDNGYIEI